MLHVVHKFTRVPEGAVTIDTTAKSGLWSQLSPFLLPCGALYGGHSSVNVENAWQFAKLYAAHADAEGRPTEAYWAWAKAGWADSKAHRYPMGKGARPLHSWWAGEALGYIDARKRIYAPLYSRSVVGTEAFAKLKGLLSSGSRDIYLRDWDGYDHVKLGLSIGEVANNPTKKMGHAFVLWALLTGTYDDLVASVRPPAQGELL